jgi:peroxiredoxin
MAAIACHTPAPLFALTDFNGTMVALADFIGRDNVLLVFNRGFF